MSNTIKILIGTTNPSKIPRFQGFLKGYDIEFYTLNDLNIVDEPEESGKTPIENAEIKARFYGRYFDIVICNDSGLYFDCLPLDDPRQPGLNIRTPQGRERMSDEESIEYYSTLVHSLGGKVLAYYVDGIAVYKQGKVHTFMETGEVNRASAFYMVDVPSPKRQAGWPLNSISINRNTNDYFVDGGNNKYDPVREDIMIGQYRARVIEFLKKSLELV